MLLNIDSYAAANVILTGVIAAFVFFVMFGWLRLSAAALYKIASAVRRALLPQPITD